MEQPASEVDRTLGKLPVQGLGAPGTPTSIGVSDARPSLHKQLHKLGDSLQEASFRGQNMIQGQVESSCGTPIWKSHRSFKRSLFALFLLTHFAFEEPIRHKLQNQTPVSRLHDVVFQVRIEVENLQNVVGHLAKFSFGKMVQLTDLPQESDHQQQQQQ